MVEKEGGKITLLGELLRMLKRMDCHVMLKATLKISLDLEVKYLLIAMFYSPASMHYYAPGCTFPC